ncbi:MAG: hypothetical protein BGO69_07445 [Bacteroidetes bacterium 46-16]|nr:MAG: hypothetical protein BGO69_07445 [Bacteroidetes bacterium 46-16]
MKKLSILYLSACLLCGAMACNDNENTGTEPAVQQDTIGGEPAPSSNKVNLDNTQVDSLRNTTDIKIDTPASGMH